MIYSSLDIRHNRQNFLSYWAIFCSFNPPLPPPTQPRKSNFWKNQKIAWRYYHFIHVYHEWQSWWTTPEIWSATDRIFCHFFLPFLHFYPLTIRKIKMRKTPGDISILQMCTINDNHMVYGSWDMEPDGQNVLPFWTIFALLPLKNQNFENTKKTPGDIILQKCTKYHDHMLLSVLHPDIFWAYCFLKLRIG